MKRLLSSAALLSVVTLAACGGAGSRSALPTVATASASNVTGGGADRFAKDLIGGLSLSVSLFDAPIPWGSVHVNVALAGIDVVSTANVAYPVATYQTAKIVDLLSLRQAPLAVSGTVPAGSYAALRLVIDPSKSSFQIGPLKIPFAWAGNAASTPSLVAIDSAIAVNGGRGESVGITADFNVLESLSFSGGKARLAPHLLATANAATIEGRLSNAAGKPVIGAAVTAHDGNGALVNSTVSGGDGSFTLRALPSGSYTVAVQNDYTGANGTSVQATNADAGAAPTAIVDVTPNAVVDIGTLED